MKTLLLLFIMISGFASAQFEITESSKDWKKIGSNWASELYINNGVAKIRFNDERSKKATSFGDMYKNNTQKEITRIADGVENINSGIQKGYYEFDFSASGDTIEKLYAVISEHFKEKNKEKVTLNFPEGNLYLDFNSRTGFYAVSFGIDSNGQQIYSSPFLLKAVDKLFGKK